MVVVGAHLSGQPLNHQLVELGGALVRACATAPTYRLYALPAAVPPKPGLVRVREGGRAIEVEVWSLETRAFGAFVAAIPKPLCVGSIELDDGTHAQGFLCESDAVVGATDISHHGGWRAYLDASEWPRPPNAAKTAKPVSRKCKGSETNSKLAPGHTSAMARFLVPFGLLLALFGCSKDSPDSTAAPASPAASTSASAATAPPAAAKAPLRVAYSDWPGWTAFEVGIQKGWFKEAGIDVEFSWADYGATLDNFSAGKADAVMVTNGDALVTGANGAKSKMILLTDYSNGNDKVVGRPGIKTFKDLKGKKVGLELTLVEQLLFQKGCEKNGINPKDVTLVGTKTNDTPQVLGSKQVDAIAAWYPIASQALATVPGLDAALHQRRRARPHLRLGRRDADEPRAAA